MLLASAKRLETQLQCNMIRIRSRLVRKGCSAYAVPVINDAVCWFSNCASNIGGVYFGDVERHLFQEGEVPCTQRNVGLLELSGPSDLPASSIVPYLPLHSFWRIDVLSDQQIPLAPLEVVWQDS